MCISIQPMHPCSTSPSTIPARALWASCAWQLWFYHGLLLCTYEPVTRPQSQGVVSGACGFLKPCAYPKLLMVTTHASTQQALQLGQSPPASKPCIHTGTTDSRRGIPHRCWRMLKCAKLVYGSIWVYLLLSRFITRSEHLSTSYRYCPFAGWCRQITHARSARLHLSLLAPFSIATFYQLPPN